MKKTPKKLKDIDKIMLDKIESHTKTNSKKEKNIPLKPQPLLCDKCGGILEIVMPKIMMTNLTLLECIRCKERCYKKIEKI